MRRLGTLGVILLVALGGCLGGSQAGSQDADPSTSDPTSPTTKSPTKSPKPTSNPPPSTSPSPGPTNPPPGGGGGNGNVSQTPQAPWPDINSATIRPGVQVESSVGQCTTNFLFRSLDNATLYLGTAAHCVDGLDNGTVVTIQGAASAGHLVYSSWNVLGLSDCVDAQGFVNGGQCENDFALVSIDNADRAKVHPALRHFGGPTTLGDSKQLHQQDRVLGYGNSGLWFGVETLHWHEGVVTSTQVSAQFRILTIPPGVQGDSGSAVIGKDGRALGVLVTGCIAPCTGQNGIVGLQMAMDLARDRGGVNVLLVTWDLVDDGLIP